MIIKHTAHKYILFIMLTSFEYFRFQNFTPCLFTKNVTILETILVTIFTLRVFKTRAVTRTLIGDGVYSCIHVLPDLLIRDRGAGWLTGLKPHQ